MNDEKICFITCVNCIDDYEEGLLYLKHLDVPNGMELEFLSVEQAESMTAGYQAAMHASDAKYKIYLHQDTMVIKRDFLQVLLHIFRKHPDIGLVGLAGCKKLPQNGVWWLGEGVYEHLAEANSPEDLLVKKKGKMESQISYMEAVDGFLMATQYDVAWRDDVFKGWHFYDISACIEFRRAGYRVAVPRQNEPWCIHECGDKWLDDEYQHWKDIFRNTYGFSETIQKN